MAAAEWTGEGAATLASQAVSFAPLGRGDASTAALLSPAGPSASTKLHWAAAWFASGTPDVRSAHTLSREQWLCFHPRTGRYTKWHALLPALLIQIVVGSFYSTSIFNHRNDVEIWATPGTNAQMFIACVACYGLGTFLLGSWVGRVGAFTACSRTLVLTPLGWGAACAACLTRSVPLLWLYGILHGFGCACGYISTTSMVAQWHPQAKGLFAGIAVFGAGLGSYIWTLFARALMDPAGPWRLAPAQVMGTFALLFAAVILLTLPFIRNPPPLPSPCPLVPSGDTAVEAAEGDAKKGVATDVAATLIPPPPPSPPHVLVTPSPRCAPFLGLPYATSSDQPYTFATAITSLEFACTAAIVFGCALPGVVFLSSAADMAQNVFGLDAQFASLVASWLNLVNFVGRFVWGAASDILGRKLFWLVACAMQSVALAVMVVSIHRLAWAPWLAAFLTVGSLYGGLFGVLPAMTSELWGKHVSSGTHGALISVWALACVAGAPVFAAVNVRYAVPVVIGGVTTRVPSAEGYALNATWLAMLPALALIGGICLNVRREDRVASRATHTCRVRCGPAVLVCCGKGQGGVRCLSRAQQAEENATLSG